MDELLRKRFNVACLFAKKLAGELTEEESRKLEEWLQESPRHRKEFEKLQEELSNDKTTLKLQQEGVRMVENRWQQFKLQLIRRRRYRVLSRMRYAAIFLLPVLTALYFLVFWQPKETLQEPVNPISPGTQKVCLVLDDGRQVVLDSSVQINVQTAPGIQVEIDNNILVYTSENSKPLPSEKYNTLIIPRGGEYALQLSDGSRVWLNAETTLKYPVTFAGAERKVELKGEAYFEVAKDSRHPFIVSVDGIDVQVLGTSFNVSAYEGEKVITTLVEGKVLVKSEKEKITLTPDRQATWDGNSLVVEKVNARNYALWREGVFFFEDMPLEDILDALARWYDVHIFFQNPELKDMHFSMEIRRYENIGAILRRMAQTNRVKFDIKNRTINVYE